MNKNLLKTVLAAILLVVGTIGAWAEEVTETYKFQDWAKAIGSIENLSFDGTGLNVGDDEAKPTATVYTITNVLNGNSLNDRFAATSKLWLRNHTNLNNTGLFVSSGNNAYFSIRNLKNGDKVKITSASNTYFYFASSCVTDEVKVSSSFSCKKNGNDDPTITVDEGSTTLTSGKTYTIKTDKETTHLDFWMAHYAQISTIEITTTVDEETVNEPIISVTGANGGNRTVSISAAKGNLGTTPTVYYTTDGTEPTKSNGTQYKDPFTVSTTSTVKAISYISDDIISDVASLDVEAGTTIKLADITNSITDMIQDGEKYYPQYSFSIDNSKLIGAPTATLSATFNESTVELTNNTYTPKEAGTLVITATADGYANATATIECKGGYSLLKAIDIKGMKSDDIDTQYWTKNDNETTATQWKFNEAENYTLKNNDYITKGIDGLTLFSDGDLARIYIGYGLQQHSTNVNYSQVSVTNGTEEQLVEWNYMNNYNSKIVKKVHKGNEEFSLYRFSWMITSVNIYTQAEDVTKTISSSTNLASYSASSNTAVPDGVSVYKGKVDGTNVVLTKVETKVIPANTGVILRCEEGKDITFSVTLDASEADFTDNELIPTSVEANATVPSEGTFYALSASTQEFCKLANSLTLSGNKAYLKASNTSQAKTVLSITFDDDETTGISSAVKAAGISGAYYTLQGVKTLKPAKGLYIHNGKKVIVK